MTEDPIRDGMNWYVYCNSNPLMFVDPSGLDFILLTQSDAVFGFGHTSALVQDSNGDWYFFFYGGTVTLTKVTKLESLALFNSYLVSKGIMKSGDVPYDRSVYIKGDFTSTFEYYKNETIKWANEKGDYKKVIFGFKNYNPNYDVLFNNCSQVALKGMLLGNLNDDITVGEYLENKGIDLSKFQTGEDLLPIPNRPIPNVNHTVISEAFYNDAFTYKDYEKAIKALGKKINNMNSFEIFALGFMINDYEILSKVS